MVLAGMVNKELVRLIERRGGKAVGLTGKDGGMVYATRYREDMGRVGVVDTVDRSIVDHVLTDYIPVIAPLAIGEDGGTLNVNADPFAAALAVALGADKLVLLTDVAGVVDADGALISSLRADHADRMIDAGTIAGGMIPKVQNAIEALDAGVDKVHIVNGRIEHALLLEIFTNEGVGTEVIHEEANGA